MTVNTFYFSYTYILKIKKVLSLFRSVFYIKYSNLEKYLNFSLHIRENSVNYDCTAYVACDFVMGK